MKAALHIPRFNYGTSDSDISENLKNIVQKAEEVGFERLSVMDHYFQIQGVGEYKDPMMEAYTTLGFIAANTKKIKIGTLVTGVTYRNPAFLVKQVTALDVLSQGRAFLGIGAAWNEQESLALGFNFPPIKERFERLEETLQIVKKMWSGDSTPYKGEYYSLQEPFNSPQVLTKPHPEILIGGSGEQKTLKLVAKYADSCNLFAAEQDIIKHKLEVLKNHCDDLGRDYSSIHKTALARIDLSNLNKFVEDAKILSELGIDEMFFMVPEAEKLNNLEKIGEKVIVKISEQ